MAISVKKSTLAQQPQFSVQDGSAIYASLREQVTAEGILERSYGYYSVLIACTLFGFFLSAAGIFMTPLSVELLVWCLVFSFASVQVAGLMHDAGHRAILATALFNDVVGHVMGGLLAMSFHDWRSEHNQHHAHPNQEEKDPDIELPFISLSRERFLARKGFSKLLSPYQMYLWYPLCWFVSIYKRLDGYTYFRRELSKSNAWQLGLYVLGLGMWFVLPFVFFDLTKALVVVAITNVVSGFYLANIFAPNHKGMPYVPKDVKLSFIEQQVITSRSIRPGLLTDFLYLGLNYQIEHHLFPTCPRNKLKLLTPHVRRACSQLGLEFTQVGVFESNRIILAELKRIASSTANVG